MAYISDADRNTPTGVGKTVVDAVGVNGEGKHPHGRGEDSITGSGWGASPETPPRAWGRPIRARGTPPALGNTPTGVGKTCLRLLRWLRLWKHPHGRGEDLRIGIGASLLGETPPRAWGRQQHFVAVAYLTTIYGKKLN